MLKLLIRVQFGREKLLEKTGGGWLHLDECAFCSVWPNLHETVCYSPHYKHLSVTAGVGSGEDAVSRKPAIRLENSQETHSLSIDSEWLALPTSPLSCLPIKWFSFKSQQKHFSKLLSPEVWELHFQWQKEKMS